MYCTYGTYICSWYGRLPPLPGYDGTMIHLDFVSGRMGRWADGQMGREADGVR